MIAVVLTGVAVVLAPGSTSVAAQSADATFDYSPHRGVPGSPVDVVARCVSAGSTTGVQLLVVLDQSDGGYDHHQAYAPAEDGSISGVFEIPADAPPGEYSLSGSCYVNGARFSQDAGAFEVAAATSPTTRATRTTPSASDDNTTDVLRVLVLLMATGSVLLVGYGEWSRRSRP